MSNIQYFSVLVYLHTKNYWDCLVLDFSPQATSWQCDFHSLLLIEVSAFGLRSVMLGVLLLKVALYIFSEKTAT